MSATVLSVRDLVLRLGSRTILDKVSFDIASGDLVALLGRNGAGKTSLLRTMLGLIAPAAGSVHLYGKALSSIRRREMAPLIAYVPQSHVPAFPYTVYEIVAMGRSAQSRWGRKLDARNHAIVDEALAALGLADCSDRVYATLSGGERQAVLLARALVQKAQIILMDEPTSSLDFGQRARFMSLLAKLAKLGYAILATLHEPEVVVQSFDRVMLLHEQRISDDGHPMRVLTEKNLSRLYGLPVVRTDFDEKVSFKALES